MRVIESFVDGRVRLRSPLFAETDIAESLADCLKTVKGVRSVNFNARTHGMLLEYDPLQIPRELLIKAAPLLERLGLLGELPFSERRSSAEQLLGELKNLLLD